jgi:hypothetical protein
MPLLTITPRDCLTQSLRIALGQIAKCDVCDIEENFPEVRWSAHAMMRELEDRAVKLGVNWQELYEDVIASESIRAEYVTDEDAQLI